MDNDKIGMAWTEFVNHQVILPIVPAMVANSWQRCRAHINPDQKIQFSKLNADHLLATHVASFDLISIARPIMEHIYQNIDHTDTVILLVNGTGYILDLLAEPALIKREQDLENIVGVLFTEEHVGTNSIGLALIERKPVQVIGPEHYCTQFHQLAGAAAPIFDMTGRILGVVGLLTTLERYQPHSLGIVAAGARAIQAQRHADVLLAEYNSQLSQLNAILDAISEGILVWDSDGELMHINTYATRLINMDARALAGQKIEKFFSSSVPLQAAIRNRKPLTDVEADINFGGRIIKCVLSLRFVLNKTDLQWIIVNFRPIKEVRQLVQRQLGAHTNLTLEDVPSESIQMKRIHNQVKSIAAAKACILIRGEKGTGKNVLANAIHNESPRREGPFLTFSCASVPNELVISDLLGNEEGYGVDHKESRPSKFELAHGGSLFFQDIENLSLEGQTILLDVIEMGVLRRLGSELPVQVDVRIIAATSAKIETLVDQGNFRSDLYFRMSTFTINLPPLREHPKDIPILVQRILKRISGQIGKPLSLGSGVLDALKKYPWPGNIWELEAYLGRAASRVDTSGMIELAHLPVSLHFPRNLLLKNQVISTLQPLSEVERNAILQTAQRCRGNVSQMSVALGISRTTLWRRMKKYAILPDDYRH